VSERERERERVCVCERKERVNMSVCICASVMKNKTQIKTSKFEERECRRARYKCIAVSSKFYVDGFVVVVIFVVRVFVARDDSRR